MATKYGLKIWSSNHDLLPLAAEACRNGAADFVELYARPGQVDLESLKPLKGIDIAIHGPHENHGFDLGNLSAEAVGWWKNDVLPLADFLLANEIIVHAGTGTDLETFGQNFSRIDDPRILIENMPKAALGGGVCFGYSLEQLAEIKKRTEREFCLDIGHAIKSAISQNLDPKEFLTSILESFNPSYFHLSDGNTGQPVDEHLALGDGDYDLSWIHAQLDALAARRDIRIVFEVPKVGQTLDSDLAAISRFKQL